MKISKLLEYQEVDKEFQKLNRNLMKSDEAKAVSASKKKVAEAKDELIRLDRMSGEIIASFEKNMEKLAVNQEKVKEFKKALKEIDDIKEIDYVQKKLDELIYECDQLNREILQLKAKINGIKQKTSEAMTLGKDSQLKYKESKSAFDKLKDEMNPEAQAVLEKLEKIEKEINDSLLVERYKNIKADNKFPVVVIAENSSCMGCGMNLASDLQMKLKSNKDLAECPNCGRMLYLAE